jgi:membrane-associated phospholipid phosphatase
MPAPPTRSEASNYVGRLLTLVWLSFAQLVRSPSHSRRAEAARRSARHVLLLVVIIGAVVITLMVAVDVAEISLMPPRDTPSLWWVKMLTNFGKDVYVMWTLGVLLVAVALAAPALHGVSRATLLGFGTRLQYLFLSVALSAAIGELLKWIVGRGRPFVGGKANAFNFQHFAGTEAYASLPSGHAITAFALAFAVSAVWPRLRIIMLVYALVIAATRLVLLAHHPSDVVAGALVGTIGAMTVRYWFAARRLGFAIHRDGSVMALSGASKGRLKRVARSAFAP